ncbi:MAG TPA: hypothetical protein VJV03_04015, partial [Pyrinomonadaceae bacterium]|nr:hypothetical protein [Pyrinomonadaceae bacterium]
MENHVPAREAGDSSFIIRDLRGLRYRTLRALYSSYWPATWGSAPLSIIKTYLTVCYQDILYSFSATGILLEVRRSISLMVRWRKVTTNLSS